MLSAQLVVSEEVLDGGGDFVWEKEKLSGWLANFGGERIKAEFFGAFGHGGEHAADFAGELEKWAGGYWVEVAVIHGADDPVLSFVVLAFSVTEFALEVLDVVPLAPGFGDLGSDGPGCTTKLIG